MPLGVDTDGGGVDDALEAVLGYDPSNPLDDWQADILANVIGMKTSYAYDANRDSDGDGIPDVNERFRGLNPYADSDWDGDGLNNSVEARLGLNPRLADSDGNGVADGAEDTDQDGLTNSWPRSLDVLIRPLLSSTRFWRKRENWDFEQFSWKFAKMAPHPLDKWSVPVFSVGPTVGSWIFTPTS